MKKMTIGLTITMMVIMEATSICWATGVIKIDHTTYKNGTGTNIGSYVTYFNKVRLGNHRIYDAEGNFVKLYNEAFVLEK